MRGVSDPRDCLSEVLEWRRGNRPDRRFTGLFRGDLADITGGWRAQATHPETDTWWGSVVEHKRPSTEANNATLTHRSILMEACDRESLTEAEH